MDQKKRKRDDVFDFICDYCEQHNGASPTLREIALHFTVVWETARDHVNKLIVEKRLTRLDGKIVVVGATWKRPMEHGVPPRPEPDITYYTRMG